MVKKIAISDRSYDWLKARGRGKSTPAQVLEGVINLVKQIEKDQAKYRAWIVSSMGKTEAEKEKEDQKGGD